MHYFHFDRCLRLVLALDWGKHGLSSIQHLLCQSLSLGPNLSVFTSLGKCKVWKVYALELPTDLLRFLLFLVFSQINKIRFNRSLWSTEMNWFHFGLVNSDFWRSYFFPCISNFAVRRLVRRMNIRADSAVCKCHLILVNPKWRPNILIQWKKTVYKMRLVEVKIIAEFIFLS